MPLPGAGKVAKALLKKRDLATAVDHVYGINWVASAAQSMNMPQHIVVIGEASFGDTRLDAMTGTLTEERARIAEALRPESALVVVVDGDASWASFEAKRTGTGLPAALASVKALKRIQALQAEWEACRSVDLEGVVNVPVLMIYVCTVLTAKCSQ